MDLKSLQFKAAYCSDDDDLLHDFYIPALSNSISYRRLAGYFSSNALAAAAKGIASFVKNGGRIQLIANVVLSEGDQEAIQDALKKKEQEVLIEIDHLEDELKKNHIRMLCWLIRENRLEIKIGVVAKGIEHEKTGILEDANGNIISFSGSDNETVYGWLHNHEKFHVFCSWKDGDLHHLESDINIFERLWANQAKRIRVYNISEAFRRGLITKAPTSNVEFDELSQIATDELIREHCQAYGVQAKQARDFLSRLWDYQKDAIDAWTSNNYSGILSMATGTGKTKTAIGCLLTLRTKQSKLFTIICCPQNTILKQWDKEISELNICDYSLIADSTNSKWQKQLADKVIDYNNGLINHCIVYTTYNTLSSSKFIAITSSLVNQVLIVCDEVHWAGANTFSEGLLPVYTHRLGLSATPSRYMDDEGTGVVEQYFSGVVYEFSLERALKEINPLTGQTFLCPYNYYPIFVALDDHELTQYTELTAKISRLVSQSQDGKNNLSEYLQRLFEKRQAIVTNAISKYSAYESLLDSLKSISFLLVYSSPDQISRAQEILNHRFIINHRFTGVESTTVQARYGNKSEREYILNNFEKGDYQALVAMKCLDEGINIERAERAVLLASSGNPKEYIQRRGRLLRRHKDKKIAYIYDLLVVPYLDKASARNASEDELKIVKKELRRYEEFAAAAENKLEAMSAILTIRDLYDFYGEVD